MSLFRNPPETLYADTGDGFVGYQVFGSGSTDILFVTQMVSNVEAMWESPQVAAYFDQLAACGRVIFSEYRGVGVSDPFPLARNPSFDDILTDARAVMDAAGFADGVIIGDTEAGPMAMMMAATYPDRISGLVLVNSYARLLRDANYPIGLPRELADVVVEWVKENWSKPEFFTQTAPSIVGDDRLLEWLGHFQRLANSPGQAAKIYDWYSTIDVRSILSNIGQPTLVIGHTDAAYHRVTYSRYLADHIPNAKLVELPGFDTSPYFLANPGPVLAEIEEFLTGRRATPVTDRILATVMFTDIVDSTRLAAEMGDQRWTTLLDDHNELIASYVERFKGRQVSTTGDGVVAIFDGPTRALTCAGQLREAMANLGLEIRAGLHTGEVELKDDGDIAGLAVHIAARVTAEVAGSDVVVSSTVRDLVAGSGIEFDPLGAQVLKGVPGEWSLFRLNSLPPVFRLNL